MPESKNVTIRTTLTFTHVEGDTLVPGQSVSIEDFLLDAFAGHNGGENGADKPLRVIVTDNDGHEAVYELALVED